LQHYTGVALENIPKGSPGRPSYYFINSAVKRLEQLWIKVVGSKPTLTYRASGGGQTVGDFLDVCQLALGPVLESHGIATDLERAARDVVYGSKRHMREPPLNPYR
jgi:hypothetical protein